jgi:serine/threonine-protein phosphatase 2A activator
VVLIEVLDRIEALAKETPPVDNAASRFGNPAFKTFYDKVQEVRDISPSSRLMQHG